MTQHPDSQPLTRKQLREQRNTASTPIVDADADALPDEETAVSDRSDAAVEKDHPRTDPVPAPRPRPAPPMEVQQAPMPDAGVDLDATPLTRRQARQQEQIRTASVPVITADVIAAARLSGVPSDPDSDVHDETRPGEDASAEAETDGSFEEQEAHEPLDAADDHDIEEASQAGEESGQGAAAHETDRAVVNPDFGAELLAGEASGVALPPSFDEILARGVSTQGSSATPNALILSQTPEGAMMGPVTATGEVLITGTYALPEGLGSRGHAPGTADGKDVDAVLVDGELPAHSSPTPIAASSAISTVKNTGDVIRPPTPEKSGRLMMALAITAGVLALALVGVLILAFITGAF